MENQRIINSLYKGEFIEIKSEQPDLIVEIIYKEKRTAADELFYLNPGHNKRRQNKKTIIEMICQNRYSEWGRKNLNLNESNFFVSEFNQDVEFMHICYYYLEKIKSGLCDTIEMYNMELDDSITTKKKLIDKTTYKIISPLIKLDEIIVGNLLSVKLTFHKDFNIKDCKLGISNIDVICIKEYLSQELSSYVFEFKNLFTNYPEYVLQADNFLYRFQGQVKCHHNIIISCEILENQITLLFNQLLHNTYEVLLISENYILSNQFINLKDKNEKHIIVFRSINEVDTKLICIIRIEEYSFVIFNNILH